MFIFATETIISDVYKRQIKIFLPETNYYFSVSRFYKRSFKTIRKNNFLGEEKEYRKKYKEYQSGDNQAAAK